MEKFPEIVGEYKEVISIVKTLQEKLKEVKTRKKELEEALMSLMISNDVAVIGVKSMGKTIVLKRRAKKTPLSKSFIRSKLLDALKNDSVVDKIMDELYAHRPVSGESGQITFGKYGH